MRVPKPVAVLIAAAVTAGVLAGGAPGASAVQVAHPAVVSTVPAAGTPDVLDNVQLDGIVNDIVQIGSTVVVGGNFPSVVSKDTGTTVAQSHVMAFDATTGAVIPGFDPVLNGAVNVVRAGADGTVYVGGQFGKLGGNAVNSLVRLRLADGEPYGTFTSPLVGGSVKALEVVGTRLFVGGTFTTTRGRTGLATLDADSGALDTYLDSTVAGHHNWYEGSTGNSALTGVTDLDVSPDGRHLVAIGNFDKVDEVTSGVDQIARWDLGTTAATVRSWRTTRFSDACIASKFDSWVRDVAFSPDGSYFVVASSGGFGLNALCDTASRWPTADSGDDRTPTWVASTGGDSLLSVAITGAAVYVGGHQRWLNNGLVKDAAGPGAVPRPGVAALDPLTGLPLAWNPGRHPRGFGVEALYATPAGLWMGSDTEVIGIGGTRQVRKRLAFFPLQSTTPRDTSVPGLPGGVYLGQRVPAVVTSSVLHRVNAGGPALLARDAGPEWSEDVGATSKYRPVDTGTSTAPAAPFPGPIPTMDSTVPAATTPSSVFADHRQDGGRKGDGKEMLWRFPVPAGKAVTVRLYFAVRGSTYAALGKRVQDVTVDGRLVADDLDVYQVAGFQNGAMRSYAVTSDGSVDVQFLHEVGSPAVAAIELVATGAAATPLPAGKLRARSFSGTAVGSADVATNSTMDTNGVRGATLIGGQLFYGKNDGKLYRRTLSGSSWSTSALLDPHNDAVWSTVPTGSRTSTDQPIYYRGVASTFADDLTNITTMFYEPTTSRLYYTLYRQTAMYYRAFSPDSGVVHHDRGVAPGVVVPLDIVGAFFTGGHLYYVKSSANTLHKVPFSGTGPLVTPTTIAPPTGFDWRSRTLFLGPAPS